MRTPCRRPVVFATAVLLFVAVLKTQNLKSSSESINPRRKRKFWHVRPAGGMHAVGLCGGAESQLAETHGNVDKAIQNLDTLEQPIDRYMAMRALEESNPKLFHKLLQQHTAKILPYVYTPTVGEACERYHELGIKTRGLYLTPADRGSILEKLKAWPKQDIKVIVVTDGERILGLGDLGAGGMGISEGKIMLYSAIGGIHPTALLPICIDIGTNNEALLKDEKYKGVRQRRLQGEAYSSYIDEFIQAIKAWSPHIFVQFEDFANHNAFVLLNRYRDDTPCFNDDIQGTATIGLAGILAGMRRSGGDLTKQKFLFFGAGEAATGIAELIIMALKTWYNLSDEEARSRCILYDSKGLVSKRRKDAGGLQPHKLGFAHDFPWDADGKEDESPKNLLEAVRKIKPTALIGSATRPGAFTKEIIEEMAKLNAFPIIFPLSNPTSKAECTFEDALRWSSRRVVFASGSPFEHVDLGPATGKAYAAQANNAYIFPAVGHAAVITKAKSIPDELLLEVAKKLADMQSPSDLESGRLFPPFTYIREVSIKLIAHMCRRICELGLAQDTTVCDKSPSEWEQFVSGLMYTA